MTKITQTYYISTGKKNAMYTLRCRRDAEGQAASMYAFMPDFYLCNLAATEERAVEKATEFVEAMRERIGEREDFRIVFDPTPEIEADKRRGKLSIYDTRKLETIESGVFPFGKHAGSRIEAAPESYVLFFADKAADPANDIVMQALSAACAGVALEQGYIARRDERRAELAALDALSGHIGTIGERRDFEGELYAVFFKGDEFGGYWINKVRCGNDVVSYIGSKALGEKGEVVKFRATIKKHDEYKGVKSTQVNRPA